jgi:hypothetical protein
VVTGDSGCEAYTAIAWGVGLNLERSDIAGAEGFHSLEGNMCGTVTRGADALPGSKATSRAKGSHRKLGDLGFGHRCRVVSSSAMKRTSLPLRRRAFIAGLGSAAAWPMVAQGQRSVKVYRVGYLSAGSPGDPFLFVFTDALRELGWIEGKTIIIEPLYAEDRIDLLPQLAAELVQRNVDVIVAVGTLAALAAKRATTTIPIVMALAGDPLGSGLVVSLAHPGGNVTD